MVYGCPKTMEPLPVSPDAADHHHQGLQHHDDGIDGANEEESVDTAEDAVRLEVQSPLPSDGDPAKGKIIQIKISSQWLEV